MDNSRQRADVQAYLRESAAVKQRTAEYCADTIIAAAGLMVESFRAGGKVLPCGNGGSAAGCQHMATDFVSRVNRDVEVTGLPAIVVTAESSFVTAFTNDGGYEGVFERQLRTLGKRGDVLIGITTSGNSRNVLRAIEAALDRNSVAARGVVPGGIS